MHLSVYLGAPPNFPLAKQRLLWKSRGLLGPNNTLKCISNAFKCIFTSRGNVKSRYVATSNVLSVDPMSKILKVFGPKIPPPPFRGGGVSLDTIREVAGEGRKACNS